VSLGIASSRSQADLPSLVRTSSAHEKRIRSSIPLALRFPQTDAQHDVVTASAPSAGKPKSKWRVPCFVRTFHLYPKPVFIPAHLNLSRVESVHVQRRKLLPGCGLVRRRFGDDSGTGLPLTPLRGKGWREGSRKHFRLRPSNNDGGDLESTHEDPPKLETFRQWRVLDQTR